jgi:hypothetical protein
MTRGRRTPGLFCARHSDTVVVTPDYQETITDAPLGAAKCAKCANFATFGGVGR